MSRSIDEYDEGTAMPVPNDENKHLEEELARHQREISNLQSEYNNNDERVHTLNQHLKNVRQELTHNLGLLNAHIKETDTEEHMTAIAEREDGRLKQEIGKFETDLVGIREKRNNSENKIFVHSQQLEELKSQMNWDQQALEAWLEESARRDEDFMTINKYAQQDETKTKELWLKLQHLTTEAKQKRRYLDMETIETLTTQIELDKTAEEFRKTHKERQELIEQWEVTIEQMQRRDREMDQAAALLAKVKEDIRHREQIINEKQIFLDNEVDNNKEMEKKIAGQERLAAKLRIQHQEHENDRVRLQDELDTLKYTVERTATDLEGMKTSVANLKKEIIEKADKLHQATKTREQLQDKLAAANDGTLSAEEKAKYAEESLNIEEQALKDIHTDLVRIRDIQYKKKEEVHDCMLEEKGISSEIQGGRAASRNLSSRLGKLDEQSVKQQEIIYNQNFTIQQSKRRIAKMQGDVNTEEKIELETKIDLLTANLEEKLSIQTVLTNQLKRLQDDIRRQKRDMDKTGQEKAMLTSKIEELNLHNEISQKELKTTIKTKQESMVEDNILKLEIKRLSDSLHKKADTVFNLEKRNLQLHTAMKERKKEIEVHCDMLFSQLKAAEEERLTVSLELHQRIAKIEKLRKRYEIFMVSMAPPEGEEEKSQAYYVIKAAQDKEELQRTGDELDAKIRKAEKEIRALENTLRLMNSRNETYRKSFNKVTETSEEYELKAQLDEQLRAAMDKYKYKRRQIRELQEDLQTMSGAMDTTYRDEAAYYEMVQERQNKITQFQKEIDEQKIKIERIKKQVAKAAREARKASGVVGISLEEQDMDLRNIKEKNRSLGKQIAEVTQQFPDVMNTVEMYFQQAGLPLPSPGPGSKSSSRASSIQSSARSSPRSSQSSARSVKSPTAVDVGLGLQVTSPVGSRPASTASSSRLSTKSTTRK